MGNVASVVTSHAACIVGATIIVIAKPACDYTARLVARSTSQTVDNKFTAIDDSVKRLATLVESANDGLAQIRSIQEALNERIDTALLPIARRPTDTAAETIVTPSSPGQGKEPYEIVATNCGMVISGSSCPTAESPLPNQSFAGLLHRYGDKGPNSVGNHVPSNNSPRGHCSENSGANAGMVALSVALSAELARNVKTSILDIIENAVDERVARKLMPQMQGVADLMHQTSVDIAGAKDLLNKKIADLAEYQKVFQVSEMSRIMHKTNADVAETKKHISDLPNVIDRTAKKYSNLLHDEHVMMFDAISAKH